MQLDIIVAAFSLIFFAELFDKTQLIIISLATKASRLKVAIGAFSSLLVVTLIGVILGGVLAAIIPLEIIKIISGIIFVIFGFFSLKSTSEINNLEMPADVNGTIVKSFVLVGLAELGDKTQLSVILFSASCGDTLFVFIGASFAFFLSTAISVILGDAIKSKFASYQKEISYIVAAIFIIIGVLLILNLF